ncbi:hypothetical protein [Arthrobacter sp. PAMC25284]|uniref:hypothetical protein n=1 Tax=Arthrobacter sp. PAMC25284 TaxID=2861279 RepID=UPI001C6250FB|nr:hypothetical protein [Arthrobacter sp. PAMC25284]QYF88496.1 hypothetical protein KY499_09365 [Arthrobacter sp. PAMC25284]
MKRPLGVALSVVALMCSLAVVLVMTGVWSPPWAASAVPDASGSMPVSQGKDVVFPGTDGAPEVFIPGSSLGGSGLLSVRPVDLPEDLHGWAIELTGATLTGPATLIFRNAVTEGTPAPLVGFTENPDDEPQYVLDTEVSGRDLVVRTTHFSNWFTLGWDWLLNSSRGAMDRIYKAAGHGEQPKCDRETEARAGDVVVNSDSGGRVQWCLGKSPDGSSVLKVNNGRGYAVAAERSPGLSIATRDTDFSQLLPRLTKYITAPSQKSNTIDIIGPGETIEYRVDPAGTVGTVGVNLQPNSAAYLATALLFGADTVAMVYKKVLGEVALGAINTAMDAANCAAGFQSMATAQVKEQSQAAKYLNDAMATVMSCTGEVFMKLAKGSLDDVFAVTVAQTFSWLWGGIQTFASGLGATVDAVLNFNGYTVTIWYRGMFTQPAPAPAVEPLTTHSGTMAGAAFSFQHPADWKVVPDQWGRVTVTKAGKKMALLEIYDVWDKVGPMVPRPATTLAPTQGVSPLSKTGPFVVRNVVMDLSPYPEDLEGIGWNKPVALSMSLTDPAPPAPTLVPYMLQGMAFVEVEKPEYDWDDMDRLVLFSSELYFDTVEKVREYEKTKEYRQIQSMIASYKG